MSANNRFSGREVARAEWWISDSGDPAALAEKFLVSHGLPAGDLGQMAARERIGRQGRVAAIHLSAAACAAMIGAHPGAASPSPAVPDMALIIYDDLRAWDRAATTSRWTLGRWEPSWTAAEHADAIRAVRVAIADGDVYQANVVGHASAPYRGDPISALLRVVELPGARYPFVLTGQDWAICCASPETLVEVRNGRIVTRPIKGTRPATAVGRLELLASEKERAEHIMIVDLARNDLARVAEVGSVRVDELFTIRRWSQLWQAESAVSAALAGGVGLSELLRAVCPGASVTGAPKLAAVGQIAALEPVGRGPSMGVLGVLTGSHLDLGLTIRTVAVDRSRVHVWAGGGITWSSDPEAEVAEAAAKAAPMQALLASETCP